MKSAFPSSRVACLAILAVLVAVAPACSKKPSDEAAEAASTAAAAVSPAAAAATSGEAQPAATPAAPASTSAQPATGQRQAPEVLSASDIPEVVARIDGEPITKVDLLSRATEARGALAQRGTQPPPPTRAFYRQVLDDVIGNRLLFRDLKAQSKAATSEEVSAQMQAIRSQFASDAEFDKALAERGFDRQRLERDVAESVTVQKWVTGVVVPSISVSDTEVRAFYDQNPERMIEPERVHARHILIRVEPQATAEARAAARQRLEALRARIAGGADFATVARESSDDKGSAERGGDLGWFYRGQMVPPFEQAAFGLAPNRLSDIVETRFGFHLVEVLEKRPQTKLEFDQVKDRLEAMLKQRQLEEKVKARINALGAKAKIEILL